MENNIDKYFKKLSEEQKPKSFPNMDNIWDKVEEKLDEKKQKRIIPLWKYFEINKKMKVAGVAATLLLLITLGGRFLNPKNPELKTTNVVLIDEEKIREEFDAVQNSEDVVVYQDTEQEEDKTQEKIVYLNSVVTEQETTSEIQVEDVARKEKAEEVVLKESLTESIAKKAQTSFVSNDKVASEKTITGVLASAEDGLPLIGATVSIKGTTNGVQTDFDGKYSITAKVGDILVFSYLGMIVQELKVGVSNVINVLLHSDNSTQMATSKGIEKTITGTVTSAEDGLPLPGATVVVEGTIRGTQTDLDGKYSINTKQGEKLVFSFIGTKSQTKEVGASNVINVALSYDNVMQEVVVMGYAVTTKVDYTGSATKTTKDKKSSKRAEKVSSSQSYESSYIPSNGAVYEVSKKEINPSYDYGYINHNDTESYENFIENQFESAKSNPVSTFSIDVDNASYTNIRRFINNGQAVPKDAVRIEEMINFFKYDYTKPTGQHPFSINTEYSDAPWNPNHKLLKIGLQGKEIPSENLPKSNFVFLVDVSGSMSAQNKLPLLQASMKVLLDELRDDDRVSIVYYANNVGVLLEPTKAKEKQKIIDVIDKMYASGGTSGGAGLELAYQMAEKHFVKGGNNRIILATDGDFNIGKSSDKDMQELIEEKRKSGVFLTCLGFGMGNYKDSKMVTLSKKGNGNYAYIDNIQEANRFLGKEFKGSMYAIAKDVKIQIEFNPAHVQAYRLVGYEMRKLRNEDFTNDAIDAGELGSGHTVTALYEVIPNGVKSDFYSYENDLKYSQTNPVTGIYQNELATVKFRYKKPDGDKSIEMIHTIPNQKTELKNASKDFKFASAVAWFGLKLRDSKLIPNKESKEIIKLAKDGVQNDTDGYKAEFIRLVKGVK